MRTIDTVEDWILDFSEMLHNYVNNIPDRITGELYGVNDLIDFVEEVVERKEEDMTRTMINTQSPFFYKGFDSGRNNMAEEIMGVYRKKKADDITKYATILTIAKKELSLKDKEQ